MSKVYVASSWRNGFQPEVVARLRGGGHEVYDFRNPPHEEGFSWSEIDSNWLNWTADEYRKALYKNPRCAQGYMSDLRAMEWADICVLVLPSGRSAHLEGGYMKGRGKRLIILTQDGEEPELMALLADDICIDMEEVFRSIGTS